MWKLACTRCQIPSVSAQIASHLKKGAAGMQLVEAGLRAIQHPAPPTQQHRKPPEQGDCGDAACGSWPARDLPIPPVSPFDPAFPPRISFRPSVIPRPSLRIICSAECRPSTAEPHPGAAAGTSRQRQTRQPALSMHASAAPHDCPPAAAHRTRTRAARDRPAPGPAVARNTARATHEGSSRVQN